MNEEQRTGYPIISCLTLGIVVASMAFAWHYTLFPAYFGFVAEQRGFQPAIVGFAYLLKFLVCVVVSVFACNKIIEKLGRKMTIIAGVLIHVPVCLLLACIPYMSDTAFIACALTARFVQGIG